MHMPMPGMGGEHHPTLHGHRRRPMMVMAFVMFHSLFFMAATTCFLQAINRVASAMKLESRLKALKAVPDAFTDEERSVLIEKITRHAVGPF